MSDTQQYASALTFAKRLSVRSDPSAFGFRGLADIHVVARGNERKAMYRDDTDRCQLSK
jgi:hypothetical protein